MKSIYSSFYIVLHLLKMTNGFHTVQLKPYLRSYHTKTYRLDRYSSSLLLLHEMKPIQNFEDKEKLPPPPKSEEKIQYDTKEKKHNHTDDLPTGDDLVPAHLFKTCIVAIAIIMAVNFLHVPEVNIAHTPPQVPETPKKGMSCVSAYCSRELSKCLSNPSCAQGLGCFIGCSTSDIVKGTSTSTGTGTNKGTSTIEHRTEGACQVRCMDLYQSPLLDDFTECSLTKNNCYECLKADDR